MIPSHVFSDHHKIIFSNQYLHNSEIMGRIPWDRGDKQYGCFGARRLKISELAPQMIQLANGNNKKADGSINISGNWSADNLQDYIVDCFNQQQEKKIQQSTFHKIFSKIFSCCYSLKTSEAKISKREIQQVFSWHNNNYQIINEECKELSEEVQAFGLNLLNAEAAFPAIQKQNQNLQNAPCFWTEISTAIEYVNTALPLSPDSMSDQPKFQSIEQLSGNQNMNMLEFKKYIYHDETQDHQKDAQIYKDLKKAFDMAQNQAEKQEIREHYMMLLFMKSRPLT